MTVISIRDGDMSIVQIKASTIIITVPNQPMTQAAWFIDSVTGSDSNDGTTAALALLTITEFMSRIGGKEIRQATVVTVSGAFAAESFQGSYTYGPTGSLQVIGTATIVQAALTLTGQTALVSTVGGEAQTLAVAGFDFTPHVGRRIRFLTGDATGMVCWIAAVDPNSVGGTANVRVSNIGSQAAVFQFFVYNLADPAIGDTFVIETMTPLAGIDIDALGGHKTVAGFIAGRTQFENFELLGGTDASRIACSDKEGVVIFSCTTDAFLQGPCGNFHLDFCHYSGNTIAFGGLDLVVDSSLISASMGTNYIGLYVSRRTVYQAAQLTVRNPSTLEIYNGFFDIAIGMFIRTTSGSCAKSGVVFGTGITDVGFKLESATTLTVNDDPTLAGPTNAIELAGTDYTTYALARAASPQTLTGAGIYTLA